MKKLSMILTGVIGGLTLAYTRGDFERPGIEKTTLGDVEQIALIMGGFALVTFLVVKAWDYLMRCYTGRMRGRNF